MSKTTAPAFPLLGGDWLKSTSTLTASERGYYLDLLIHTWDADAPIPDDERLQMQIARCTSLREWRKVWERLRPRWTAVEGGFRNRRCEEEREKLKRNRERRSASGSVGAEARWQRPAKHDGKPDSNAVANGVANGWPSISSSEDSDPKDQGQNPAPTRDLLALFDSLHQARFHVPADINGRKDASILAKIWRQRGTEQTAALIREFFAIQDAWVLERGFSVGIFKTQVSKLLVRLPKASQPAVDERVARLCASAGLQKADIAQWFAGARLEVDAESGERRLWIPDPDARGYVRRNFSHALMATLAGQHGTLNIVESEAA